MTKVFVVMAHLAYEDSWVQCIFSSEEKAEEYLNSAFEYFPPVLERGRNYKPDKHWGNRTEPIHYDIIEVKLDEVEDV